MANSTTGCDRIMLQRIHVEWDRARKPVNGRYNIYSQETDSLGSERVQANNDSVGRSRALQRPLGRPNRRRLRLRRLTVSFPADRRLRPKHRATGHLTTAQEREVRVDVAGDSGRLEGLQRGLAPGRVRHTFVLRLSDALRGPCRAGVQQRTFLDGGGWSSGLISPWRGVRQGDPLSPILFNLIMDQLLQLLPSHIGARLGEATLNATAYADYLILASNTDEDMTELLSLTEDFLTTFGLHTNVAKSRTLSIKGQPRQKTSVLRGTTKPRKNNIFRCCFVL